MKRLIMAASVLVFTAATSQAGPIRDRIAARFQRPACATCPQQAQYAQPAYQPGPVQQVVGSFIVGGGQVVQAVGQTVQAWQVPTFGVARN